MDPTIRIGLWLCACLGWPEVGTSNAVRHTPTLHHGPDLSVVAIDTSDLWGQWQTLAVTGTLTARIRNQGDLAIENTFETLFFEDIDTNRAFDPATDRTLGSVSTAGLDALTESSLALRFANTVLFRDNLILAWVDSEGVVAEFSERDNISDSGVTCVLADNLGTLPAPDITASRLMFDDGGYPPLVRMTARVGNGGSQAAAAPLRVTFYRIDAAAGDVPVATASTSRELRPGEYEDVTATWPQAAPGGGLLAVVADVGEGAGLVRECREDNNRHSVWYRFGGPRGPGTPAVPNTRSFLPLVTHAQERAAPVPTDEPND